jgi:hypothetical protein
LFELADCLWIAQVSGHGIDDASVGVFDIPSFASS